MQYNQDHSKSNSYKLHALYVLKILSKFMNGKRWHLEPFIDTIARDTRLPRQTVIKALERMEENDLLKTEYEILNPQSRCEYEEPFPEQAMPDPELRGSSELEKRSSDPLMRWAREWIRFAAERYDRDRRTGNPYPKFFNLPTLFVLKVLLKFVNGKRWHLDPFIATIAKSTRYSHETVVEALECLEEDDLLKTEHETLNPRSQCEYEEPFPEQAMPDPELHGSFEKGFSRPLTREERKRIRHAVEQYDLCHGTGRRGSGSLGPSAPYILNVLLDFMNEETGRIDPSIDMIARKAGYCRQTVVKTLNRMEEHGFLKKQRWHEYAGRREGKAGRGPQKRKMTNVYHLTVPPHARKRPLCLS